MKTYKIKYQQEGRIFTKRVKANSKNEIIAPLNTISIKEEGFSFKDIAALKGFGKKEKIDTLIHEINIIMQAGLSLNEAVDILKRKVESKFLVTISDSLKQGKPIYKALEEIEDKIGPLPILFFRLGEENGNIKNAINSLSYIMGSIEENRKRLLKALRYPVVLLMALIGSLGIILNTVLPKFEIVFESFGASLPFSTKILILFRDAMENYFLLIAAFIVMIFLFFKYKYKKSIFFKLKFDTFLIQKVPIIGNIIKESQLYLFFSSMNILMLENYKFHNAYANSKLLIKNSYMIKEFEKMELDIKQGLNISRAFEKSALLDEFALRMIYVAESSNSLDKSMQKLKKFYQESLDKKIGIMLSLIEPVFVGLTALFILWLITAVFTPIWDFGSVLR